MTPRQFPRWTTLACAGTVVLLVLLAYANSVHAPFVFDDFESVTQNPSIRDIGRLSIVLTPDSGTTAGRPLLNLSYALNYACSRENVAGYHAVNLLVHALAALVLFALVRRTLAAFPTRWSVRRAELTAAMIAALWAVHPLQTEDVSYISQRSEELMGLCYLLVLYCLARATSGRPRLWLVASVLSEYCGFGCKEVIITAPIVALLYDAAFLSGSWRVALTRRRWYYVALASGWVLVATFMIVFPIAGRGVGFNQNVDVVTYATTESVAVFRYLRLAVWPSPLVFDYGPSATVPLAQGWPFVVAIIALMFAAGWLWHRSKPLGFLAVTFFVVLSPTSSIVPVSLQPVAENRMYLPLAVVIALLVLAVDRGLSFSRRVSIGWAAGSGIIAAFTVATVARNADYRTATRLWSDTVAKVPMNPRAHTLLGTALAASHARPPAEAEFNAALRVDPRYAPAHFNLGVMLLNENRAADALPHLEQAVSVPHDRERAYLYLGQALLQLDRYADALAPLRTAMQLAPADVEPAFALGNAYAALARYDEAAAAFRAAAQRAPAQTRIRNNLANALLYGGHVDEAVEEYRRALAANPNDSSIRDNLEQALRYQALRAHAASR